MHVPSNKMTLKTDAWLYKVHRTCSNVTWPQRHVTTKLRCLQAFVNAPASCEMGRRKLSVIVTTACVACTETVQPSGHSVWAETELQQAMIIYRVVTP